MIIEVKMSLNDLLNCKNNSDVDTGVHAQSKQLSIRRRISGM